MSTQGSQSGRVVVAWVTPNSDQEDESSSLLFVNEDEETVVEAAEAFATGHDGQSPDVPLVIIQVPMDAHLAERFEYMLKAFDDGKTDDPLRTICQNIFEAGVSLGRQLEHDEGESTE